MPSFSSSPQPNPGNAPSLAALQEGVRIAHERCLESLSARDFHKFEKAYAGFFDETSKLREFELRRFNRGRNEAPKPYKMTSSPTKYWDPGPELLKIVDFTEGALEVAVGAQDFETSAKIREYGRRATKLLDFIQSAGRKPSDVIFNTSTRESSSWATSDILAVNVPLKPDQISVKLHPLKETNRVNYWIGIRQAGDEERFLAATTLAGLKDTFDGKIHIVFHQIKEGDYVALLFDPRDESKAIDRAFFHVSGKLRHFEVKIHADTKKVEVFGFNIQYQGDHGVVPSIPRPGIRDTQPSKSSGGRDWADSHGPEAPPVVATDIFRNPDGHLVGSVDEYYHKFKATGYDLSGHFEAAPESSGYRQPTSSSETES